MGAPVADSFTRLLLRFDEATATVNAVDSSLGSPNPLTIYDPAGTSFSVVSGLYGNARLNNSGNPAGFYRTPDPGTVGVAESGQQFRFNALVKADPTALTSNPGTILMLGSGNTINNYVTLHVVVLSDGRIRIRYHTPTGATVSLTQTSPGVVNTSTWTRVGVRKVYVSGAPQYRLFINNVLADVFNPANDVCFALNDGSQASLVHTAAGALWSLYHGTLDEVWLQTGAGSDADMVAYGPGPTPVAGHAVGANTVYLYRHNETSSGDSLVDSGPNVIHATGMYSASPAAPITGRVGGGRVYGASSNTRFYVDVAPASTYLRPTFASGAFTVGHLFAWNAGGGTSHNPPSHYLFSCGAGDGSNPSFRYGFDGSSFFAEWMYGGTLLTYATTAHFTLNSGDWHFLGFKWNGATFEIWVDGVLDSTHTPASPPGGPVSINASFGTREDGFNGWGGIGDECWLESTTSIDLRSEAIAYGFSPPATSTVPDAPTGVSAIAGYGAANVTWSASASDGGAAITSYTVTSTPGGITATTTSGSALSANVIGLANNTSYTFTVHATNSVGNSAESSPSNSVTTALTGGYGHAQYGQSEYGFGTLAGESAAVVQANLLVQSDTGVPGSQCVISGVGVPIVDTSRNDTFSGPSLDVGKWIVSPIGLVTTSFFESALNIGLVDSTTVPSFTLISTNVSQSADVSVRYNILSDQNIKPITHEIVFASLQFWINDSTSFTIKRTLIPGVSGQQVYVSYVVDGVEMSMALAQTSDRTGVMRLVTHNGYFWALYNGKVLYHNAAGFIGTGLIKLSVDAGGHDAPLVTQLSRFTSDTGVLFGNTLLLDRTIQLGDKINGTVPASLQVGPVDVVAFNHNGQIGSQTSGFVYPLVTGVALSANQGMSATIQLDSVLRV
jgi:hypothetical protein